MGEGWLIDTDPGLGLPVTDVDDALAIVHLAAQGVPIAGLTTCFGNAPLVQTHRVACDLGRRLGVAVHRGASRPGDVDTEAVERLVAHRGPVLALAPLTNVAAALRRGAAWERLVVLGGTERRLPNLWVLHTTELNLAVDEAAAEVTLPHVDVLCTMEPCRTTRFGRRDLSPAPRWIRRACRSWLLTSPLRTGRFAFVPWDLVAAMHLTHPHLFEVERADVRLVSRPFWRGSIHTTPSASGRTVVLRTVDGAGLRAAWRDSLRRGIR